MSTPLTDLLIKHEGLRLKPYTDTVGKLTIGVGHNLTDNGITEDEALFLLTNDLDRCRCQLNQDLPWWRDLNEARQAVVLSLCFNMGIRTLQGFVNTLGFMRNGQYDKAADNLLKSKWAEQVGQRAVELAAMMRTGKWPG